METKSWTYEDKSTWGRGEFQKEPDKIQFTDKETGLPCLIVRGPSGALCGYVGVSEGHPFYGVNYGDCHYPRLRLKAERRGTVSLGALSFLSLW